ncbi:MAG: Rrf2 family transcriptional regulator [Lentisphaeria bacterium]|nr:Rrf2 family transcriptional regulator [Lentisphaeria bacterium]
MASFFHISEAAAIGIHSCALLAVDPKTPLSARQVASELGVSYDHTVRVLHRLRQAKLLKSVRGPSGGFLLVEEPDEIRALDVYEALEGKLEDRHCLFLNVKCPDRCFLFGELTGWVNRQAREFFGRTSVGELGRRLREAWNSAGA